MISVAIFPYSLSLTYLRGEHDRLISVNLGERTSTHRKRNGKVRTLNLPNFCSVTPPPTTVSLQEGIVAPRTTGRDQSATVTLDLPPKGRFVTHMRHSRPAASRQSNQLVSARAHCQQ